MQLDKYKNNTMNLFKNVIDIPTIKRFTEDGSDIINNILEGTATQEEKDKLKNSCLNSEDIYND